MERMPRWADVILTPLISLALAFAISALVILAIGESPTEALKVMVQGALGSSYGWGFTLYYATNFIFTGLAVSVAYHAGLFNIGGEGQAAMGGLGVTLVVLTLPWPHWALALPAAMVGAAGFGALWALIPAWLQARRGSHVVITTIMFNFIAAAVLNYVLVNVLRPVGSMDPASASFPAPVRRVASANSGGMPEGNLLFMSGAFCSREFCRGGLLDSVGQGRLDGGAGMEGTQDGERGDGGAGQFRRDVLGDGRQPQDADIEHLPGIPRRLQVRAGEVPKAEIHALAGHRLPDDVGMAPDLVSDGGPDKVRPVGVEPLLHQQVDAAQIDMAEVQGDLLVVPFHAESIQAPSVWM